MEQGTRLDLRGASLPSSLVIRSPKDREELGKLLTQHQAYAAPFFKFLEPSYYPRSRCHLATGREGVALALEAPVGGGAPSLYFQGDAQTVEQSLPKLQFPRYSYLTCHESHLNAVERHFLLRGLHHLLRMQVTPSTFQPAPSRAEPLGPIQLSYMNDLYRTDSGASVNYQQVAEGPYYGIWENGRIVAIAGTQTISVGYGVAMVANVLTHKDYRGRGYATECVSALTERLLKEVPLIVLNVEPKNTSALHVYQRLGYQEAGPIAEAWAVWKGRNWWDRLLANLMAWFSQ